ncbi:MAG: response regulator transcription factor, partial [Erysipelotrichaceae bacterium]|nr:response regulator transcription factor [Erysipelotrichaceae bacterium]
EKMIVKGIRFSLLQEGWEVDAAYDGEEGVALAKSGDYDAVLLDIMLPLKSGLDVLREIREFSDMPVIMLTAKGEDIDKVTGLEYGADDYITKPFNILEVKARLKAIMRRNRMPKDNDLRTESDQIRLGKLSLDTENERVFIDREEVFVTSKEFDILKLLAGNPDKVYSREQLLKTIWGSAYPGDVRTVDVHIRRLREKIEEDPGMPKVILTKWGIGYYCRNENT